MSVSWWAKRLGTAPPPTSTPDAWNMPRYAPPTPSHVQAPQQQFVPQMEAPVLDENGQMHMADAIVRWRGGDGTKKETQTCPNCGGRNYFSRSSGQGKRIGLMNRSGQACPPAPICFECGYNGIFESFGGGLTMTEEG